MATICSPLLSTVSLNCSLFSQHRGFCDGAHTAQEDEFENRNPVARNGQNRKSVEVKCEIYEPQVPALSPVTRHTIVFINCSSDI